MAEQTIEEQLKSLLAKQMKDHFLDQDQPETSIHLNLDEEETSSSESYDLSESSEVSEIMDDDIETENYELEKSTISLNQESDNVDLSKGYSDLPEEPLEDSLAEQLVSALVGGTNNIVLSASSFQDSDQATHVFQSDIDVGTEEDSSFSDEEPEFGVLKLKNTFVLEISVSDNPAFESVREELATEGLNFYNPYRKDEAVRLLADQIVEFLKEMDESKILILTDSEVDVKPLLFQYQSFIVRQMERIFGKNLEKVENNDLISVSILSEEGENDSLEEVRFEVRVKSEVPALLSNKEQDVSKAINTLKNMLVYVNKVKKQVDTKAIFGFSVNEILNPIARQVFDDLLSRVEAGEAEIRTKHEGYDFWFCL